MGKTKRGKGTKLMAVADYTGLPISVYVASAASPHEVTLAQETVTKCFVSNEYPARLIGDIERMTATHWTIGWLSTTELN